ncbi:AI-2E family transporter [Vulgatibacter incomptus]|uniref:Membrane protein, putative n=1 Tax=Vulgatibacter incomptus TaxID=1391653 RepID=A0A0K1PDA3_9BACT|nr:AI-2E family transporter [Vulgatibacter incomptus]AKU91099.1 membrane protein, putative [Vulgatibacter incomptus]
MGWDRTIRWSTVAFIVAFVATLIAFVVVIWTYLIPVLVGAFAAVLFDAPHEALVKKFKGRRGLAAGTSTLAVTLLVFVPLATVVFVLVEQAIELVGKLKEYLGPGGLEELLGGRVPAALQPLVARLQEIGAGQQVQTMLSSLGSFFTKWLGAALGATTRLLVETILAIVSMYYFFLDGKRYLVQVSKATPLDPTYEAELVEEFRDVSQTMVFVNIVTAVVQGLVGGIGFLIVEVPTPLVWAVLMSFLSLVPILGTGLVWAPAGVILILTGRTVAGIFLLAWGLLIVGTVDNVLRPILAKGHIRLHPLLVFLTIFGGLIVFGAVGVIIGPLIGSLFTAMVRIWKRDFAPRLASR